MGRRPGTLVECQDGRLGVVYNDEPPINGKLRVHLVGVKVQNIIKPGVVVLDTKEPEKRLCDPKTLKPCGKTD